MKYPFWGSFWHPYKNTNLLQMYKYIKRILSGQAIKKYV